MNTPPPRLLSVLVPCLNEEGNVRPLASRVIKALTPIVPFEVIFVNDGSTDGTAAALAGLSDENPGVVLAVHHERNMGIEAGWRSGLAASRGNLICLMDGDLQNQPEDIPRLLSLLDDAKVDFAQGSRVPVYDTEKSRLIFSRVFNLLLNVAFGMRLNDNKSGFVVLKRPVLEVILMHQKQYRYFQCLLAVAAHCNGFTIAQTPTMFFRRASGVSFMSSFPTKVILGCLRDIAVGVGEYRGRRPTH